jgi:hypothetical protein
MKQVPFEGQRSSTPSLLCLTTWNPGSLAGLLLRFGFRRRLLYLHGHMTGKARAA